MSRLERGERFHRRLTPSTSVTSALYVEQTGGHMEGSVKLWFCSQKAGENVEGQIEIMI